MYSILLFLLISWFASSFCMEENQLIPLLYMHVPVELYSKIMHNVLTTPAPAAKRMTKWKVFCNELDRNYPSLPKSRFLPFDFYSIVAFSRTSKNNRAEIAKLFDNYNFCARMLTGKNSRFAHDYCVQKMHNLLIILFKKSQFQTIIDTHGAHYFSDAKVNTNLLISGYRSDCMEKLRTEGNIYINPTIQFRCKNSNKKPNMYCLHTKLEISLPVEQGALIKSMFANPAPCMFDRINKFGGTFLHGAVAANDTGFLKVLLQANADINMQGAQDQTPLCFAANAQRLECVQMLLDHKADATIPNVDGCTPLWRAVCNNNRDIVKLLLDHDANPNETGRNGYSVLGIAMMNEGIEICQLLRKYGASFQSVKMACEYAQLLGKFYIDKI